MMSSYSKLIATTGLILVLGLSSIAEGLIMTNRMRVLPMGRTASRSTGT
jgi:hypothetical protein